MFVAVAVIPDVVDFVNFAVVAVAVVLVVVVVVVAVVVVGGGDRAREVDIDEAPAIVNRSCVLDLLSYFCGWRRWRRGSLAHPCCPVVWLSMRLRGRGGVGGGWGVCV